MHPFYESHCHYQDPRLRNVDLAQLPSLGIRRSVVNSTSEQDWPRVADLADRWPDAIWPAYGIHPWFAGERGADWRRNLLSRLKSHPRASIGEVGLDRWIEPHDLSDQERVFLEQLEIAAEHDLAVSIHCLQAWGRLLELLQNHPRPQRGFLIHSYGGSLEMTERFAELGGHFSFAGYFLHERKHKTREVFRQLPLDRVLLETDTPDQGLPAELDDYQLANPDEEGTVVNHPGNLTVVYREFAKLRDITEQDLAIQMEANFQRFFGSG